MRLQGLLDEQGMTQVELARLAGVHPDTVSHVVHGGHCSTETLEKLAAALDVDLAELFGAPVDERTVLLKRDRVVARSCGNCRPRCRRGAAGTGGTPASAGRAASAPWT